MKKLVALVLAIMLSLTCIAFAEEATSIEELYDGTWVDFEDDGFSMYLPSDWLEMEVTDEMLEAGIYYGIVSPDAVYTFQLAWAELPVFVDIDTILAAMVDSYPDATIVNFEGYDAVCYSDTEAGVLAFAMPDTSYPGMYIFNFTPVNDETAAIASLMMSSIVPYEAEEIAE